MKSKLLFLSFLALISCGSDNNSANGETSSDNAIAEEATQKTNFKSSCLSEKIKNFPELISNAEMFKLTGKTNAGLTQEYGDYGKGFYKYDWKGKTGRKTTLINGMVVDVDDAVSIIITSTKSSAESFKRGYYPVEKTVNEEQGSKLKDEVELALKGESSNKAMNENVVKLRETGMSDEEIMKTYTGFTDLAAKSSSQKVIVNGTGDAAVWDTHTHELMVNADNMTFWVIVTLNEDDKKDLEIAKKITSRILEGCE